LLEPEEVTPQTNQELKAAYREQQKLNDEQEIMMKLATQMREKRKKAAHEKKLKKKMQRNAEKMNQEQAQ
jgi:hypothetical protein